MKSSGYCKSMKFQLRFMPIYKIGAETRYINNILSLTSISISNCSTLIYPMPQLLQDLH